MLWPRFDDDGQQELPGCGLHVDQEYNLLWSYNPQDCNFSCFNPLATSIKGMRISQCSE